MEELKFPNRASMKKWLISATGILLTSVSLMGSVEQVEVMFSKPKALAAVLEFHPGYLPEGEYLIKYTNSDDPETDQLDYSKMAMVISLEAKLNGRNILVGGLRPLLKALADFEFSATINKKNPAYLTASIWVVEPKSPPELSKLKEILDEHSVMYAFNDGSGFVTLKNARMGRGISSLVHL